jgi:hypothetical protein
VAASTPQLNPTVPVYRTESERRRDQYAARSYYADLQRREDARSPANEGDHLADRLAGLEARCEALEAALYALSRHVDVIDDRGAP